MSIIGNALNVAKTAVSTASSAAAKAVEVVAPVVPPTAPELAVDVLKDSGLGDAFSDIVDGPDDPAMTAEHDLLARPVENDESLGEQLRDARQEAKLEGNVGQAKIDAVVARVDQAKSQMALDKAHSELVSHKLNDAFDGPDTKREDKMQEMELSKLEAKLEKAQQKNLNAAVNVIKSDAALDTAEAKLGEFRFKEAQEDGKLIGIAPKLAEPAGELKGAGSAIGNAIGEVAGGAADAAGAAGGFLGNVIDAHQSIVGGAAETAGGIAGGIFDLQKNIAGGAAEAAGSFVGNVFEAQQSVVGGAAEAAGEVADGVTDAVGDVADGIGDGVKKLFGG